MRENPDKQQYYKDFEALCMEKELKGDAYSQHQPYGPYERYIKGPLDRVLAVLALIVLSPLLLITALLIRIQLGSPVVFRQTRTGKNDKLFTIYKFRTMTNKRNNDGTLAPDEERLTKFSKHLRSLSIDETLELINIAFSSMAIVGPRPLLPEYLPYYSEEQKHRHDVLPGLTGLAQVHGRNAISWDEKFAWDIQYVNKITFLGDCKIILDTIITVFRREGIHSAASATMESFIEYCKQKEGNNVESDIPV